MILFPLILLFPYVTMGIRDIGQDYKSLPTESKNVTLMAAPNSKTSIPAGNTKCEMGYYGVDYCNKTCNSNCNMGYCDIATGACRYGCLNENKYSRTSRFHGADCSKRCSNNCKLGTCFKNGTCYLGCKNGTYGPTCSSVCPPNCSGQCSEKSGTCLHGCRSGFYGLFCNLTCSKTCLNEICERHGYCSEGCRPGYYGCQCNHKCNSHCGLGKTVSTCNQTTGECHHGCADKWYGRHCNMSCSRGCLNGQCNASTGHCTSGCVPTLYGNYCDKQCRESCINRKCEHDTLRMTCSSGCVDGFWGTGCHMRCFNNCLICQQSDGHCLKCRDRTHGEKCEKLCSENCFNTSCSLNGTCTVGCVPGYYGNMCHFTCWSGCKTCNRNSGICLTCSEGRSGPSCKDEPVFFYILTGLFSVAIAALVVFILYLLIGRHRGLVTKSFCARLLLSARTPKRKSNSCLRRPDLKIHQKGGYRYSKRFTLQNEEDNVLQFLPGQDVARVDRQRKYLRTVTNLKGCYQSDRWCSRVQLKTVLQSGFQSGKCSGTQPSRISPNGCSSRKLLHSKISSQDIVSQLGQRVRSNSGHGDWAFQGEVLPSRPPQSPAPNCHANLGIGEQLKSTSIACQQINDYIWRMGLIGGLGLQFKSLPKGELAVCVEAKRPENQRMNRFKNILPYDHSRVLLRTDHSNRDYINASYIHGYGKSNFYIAAQGPFLGVKDFLKMIHQTRATSVVMLTNLSENGKMKCEKYWAEPRTFKQFDNVTVFTSLEDVKGDYCVRTLTINDWREAHTLSHYHYTAWPDHGLPRDPRSLLNFHKHVRMSFGAGPIVVHCSAGIGRTGTFIALDYLLDQAREEDQVDVQGCVTRLRHQRMNMVQTEGQYVFLHQLLALALNNSDCQEPDIFTDERVLQRLGTVTSQAEQVKNN